MKFLLAKDDHERCYLSYILKNDIVIVHKYLNK